MSTNAKQCEENGQKLEVGGQEPQVPVLAGEVVPQAAGSDPEIWRLSAEEGIAADWKRVFQGAVISEIKMITKSTLDESKMRSVNQLTAT